MILMVIGFYFAGCSDESVVSPNTASMQSDHMLIKFPLLTDSLINRIYSDTKQITGCQGGFLSLQGRYSGNPYGIVTVNATLEFTAGSFSGTKNMTMTADGGLCTSSFLPGMSFSKPGIYNITYTGVDLSGINPSTVRFVYLKTDGTLDYPSHEGIIVDQSTGTIQVINARLNHFSRYGFVN